MKNWKDYVGYGECIPSSKDNTQGGGIYLIAHVPKDQFEPVTIAMERFLVPLTDFVLTDEEVGIKVEELLNEFPVIETKNSVDVERARMNVVRTARRGVANTQFNNTHFYKGSSGTDAPIIVTHRAGKYYVFKHPNFEHYGFTVKEGNESNGLV